MKSWYPATYLTESQIKYIKCIQEIWRVYNTEMELVPYKLAPHQIHWHSQDIAVLGSKAKNRVVVKSRNTSFTTSSLISSCMAVPRYPNQILPFVRLNQNRAFDLIEECKDLIRHMQPLLINGKYYPFNPNNVDLSKIGSIKFPNGVEFRAMPANAASAETIRGMRIFGSAGIIDESNFMLGFKKIYIALRDSSRGGSDNQKHFQMNIGTTRKGRMTTFNIWFEEILKTKPVNIDIYWWPVFNFNDVNINKSLLEQEKLIPIVKWHDIYDLESKRKEDLNSFKEEYMAILVDAEDTLYSYEIIEAAIKSDYTPHTKPIEGEQYTMGVDPAATSDYFVVSIFNSAFEQRFLHYSKNVLLETMESFCARLIEVWKPLKCRIDGNGLGYQLSQTLQKKYPSIVEIIRGAVYVKNKSKVTGNVPLKEFIHTNQLKLMNYNQIVLIEDEMQIKHYMMWKNDYTCPHDTKLGHGDIVIANGLALLPKNFRYSGSAEIMTSKTKEEKKPIPKDKIKFEEVEWE